MPVYGSHGNFSVKGYGVGTGEIFLYLTTTPAPASSKSTYTVSGIEYTAIRITSTCTLNVNGPGATYPLQAFLVSGGSGAGPNSNVSSGLPGAPGGTHKTTTLNLTGGTTQPVVIGGSGTASSLGSTVSNPGGTAGGAGGPAPGTPGGTGTTNAYWTGSNQYYGGGGGGGGGDGQPVGSGGLGGGGAGSNSLRGGGGSGQANTGGGGGGPGRSDFTGPPSSVTYLPAPGSSGGSGVIVLRGPSARIR